jgi:hypothetical protein
MQLTPLRYLDVAAPLASGNAFLSAASGLVHIGHKLCVVGDDEQHLALFDKDDGAPGRLLRLLPGDLPLKKKKRKKVKPDFEILFALPASSDGGGATLCAIGSGSTEQRMRSVVVDLSSGDVVVHNLRPLFNALSPLVAEVNLEGAVVRGDHLLLFNRGNVQNPETCICAAALSAVTGDDGVAVSLVKTIALPNIEGVPLTVTDACSFDDGHILLSAVAEVTDDSYADGAILGSAIVLLDAKFNVIRVEWLEPICKIEGISARRSAAGVELLCVSDADDPDMPSRLYSATLRI